MTRSRGRFRPSAALFLAAAALVACSPRTEIRQILNDPRGFEGKTVTVEGDVGEVFSLFVIKYFQLDDGTGSIGVVSDQPLPSQGQRLRVTGKVHEAFSIGASRLTVIVEQSPQQPVR